MQVKEIARWGALGAIFLVPLMPLIVANSFFFPFITGKAFYFRILAEVAVAAWAVLAVMDKAYRPRFSWVGVFLLAFVAWMFIADAAAVNVTKAFWSNFERMEGWVLLIHLYGFFLAASNVLRVERKWRLWLLWLIGVSVIPVIHALMQLMGNAEIHQGSTRVDASFGNSAYFAVYLLLNVCVAAWLSLTEKRPWLRYALMSLAAVEAYLIFLTQTRGTILGLVGAAGFAAAATVFTAGKRARYIGAWALAVLVILIGGFIALRDSAFVTGNSTLERIASISIKDGETRFTIWGMAWEGFKERPVFGWGQEGFNYAFNKYYEPSLYAQEPWFDRAHNVFIDWLMAGGLPAFALYISLFGSAFFLLWYRSELSRPERIALSAALLGYAVHNIFVFDNLFSYVYFIALLALLDGHIGRPIAFFEEKGIVRESHGAALAASALALLLVVAYAVNLPSMRAAGDLITAVSSLQATPEQQQQFAGELAKRAEMQLGVFEELLNDDPPQAQEIREQLVSFAGMITVTSWAPQVLKERAVALARTEMEKQNAEHPGDTRTLVMLSLVYRSSGDLENALKALEEARGTSPKKPHILLQKAGLEWETGDAEAARLSTASAYGLAPQFEELAAYAAAGSIIAGDTAAADTILLDAFGTTTVDSDVLSYAYYRTNQFPRLVVFWQNRASKEGAAEESFFSLAAAQFFAGDVNAARRTLSTILERYPGSGPRVEAFVKEIQGASAVR